MSTKSIRPESYGALSLARRHMRAASGWLCRNRGKSEAYYTWHRNKAVKLARRAAMYGASRDEIAAAMEGR